MKKGYRMTAMAAAAVLAAASLFPPVPAEAEEPAPQALGEPAAGEAPGNGMLLGAVAAGSMTAEGNELKVYVAVQALPGTAGIDHINIQFKNPVNDRSVTKILRDRDYANGVYAGWITMSIYEPAGNYVLDKVILQDTNGAYLKYCRAEDREENDKYQTLPFTAGFTIANGVAVLDETPPVLGAVTVAPVQAAKESPLTVTAAVADDFPVWTRLRCALRMKREKRSASTWNIREICSIPAPSKRARRRKRVPIGSNGFRLLTIWETARYITAVTDPLPVIFSL